MSTIDDATVIANLRETVERLSSDRDFWKRFAIDRQRTVEDLAAQNGMLLQILAQKGDPQ